MREEPYKWAEFRPISKREIARPFRQKLPGQMLFMDSENQVWAFTKEHSSSGQYETLFYCEVYSESQAVK